MNLAELTLDLAEYAQGVEEHAVTSYTLETLTVTAETLSGRTGEFGGGTLWFTDHLGVVGARKIKSASGSSIVIDSAFPTGETITSILISPSADFDLSALTTAINSVLTQYPIMDYDETLLFDTDVDSYDLPATVTNDIRRVEIWRGDLYRPVWETYCYWKIADRDLFLYGDPYRYEADSKIKISYVRNHGRLSITGTVDPSINKEYVRYMAYMNLYRGQIQRRHKDNPIAVDLFNEAKNYEQQFNNRHIPKCNLLKKDMALPYYE